MNSKQLKNSVLQLAMEGKGCFDFSSDKSFNPQGEAEFDIENNYSSQKKIFDIPSHWKWTTIEKLSDLVTKGTTPSGGKSAYIEKGINFLRVLNLNNDFSVNLTDVKKIDIKIHSQDLKRSICKENDLLISIAGTLGKVAKITKKDLPCNLNQALAIIRISNELVDLEYVMYALTSPQVRSEYLSKTKTTAQPNLTLEIIRNIVIPLPPLFEQQKIARKIKELFNKIDKYNEKKESLFSLNANLAPQLETAILQFAIQGKLVNQDTSDEPSSELLKRISEHKEQMVKEKVIKKEKSLPPITEEEIPFDIPDTWEWVRLRDVALITMGQSPEGTSVGEDISGIEFHQGKSLFSKMYLSKSNQNTHSPKKIANPHSIIMSVRAPVGDVNILKDRSICIGRGLASIEPVTGIDLYYLNYYLKWAKPILENKSTGSTFKAVNLSTISSLIVPLPPTNEQIKIVKKIENMSNSIRNLNLLNER